MSHLIEMGVSLRIEWDSRHRNRRDLKKIAGPLAHRRVRAPAHVPPNPPSSKQWRPDRWTHSPQVARGGGQIGGPTSSGPFEWPQDVHKRSQDTILTIFGCKRAVLQKCLFSWRNLRVFEGRVAKLRSEHPPFFALRPPPRAIWTGI